MKTFIYLCLTVLLIGGVWFYFNKSNVSDSNSSQAVTNLSPEDIILYKESGLVSIKEPLDSVIKPVTEKSIVIKNKTVVTTGTSSRASVLLPDNSIVSLSANTEITINYTASSTNIFQSLGSTYHRVQTLIAGKSYEVQTPSTLAAVRGTKFAVIFDKEKKITKVAVTENKVAVSRVKKVTPEALPIFESPVMVESGNTANVIAYDQKEKKTEQHITVISNNKDPEVINLIQENKALDEKFIKNDKNENGSNKEKLNKTLLDKVDEQIKKDEEVKVNDKKTEELNVKIDENKKVNNEIVCAKEAKVCPDGSSVGRVGPSCEFATCPIVGEKKFDTPEEFFTAFDDLFIKYLYVDTDDGVCKINISPDQKVKELSDMVLANGHSVDNNIFLSLAKDVKNYCDSNIGDTKTRTDLQGKFDNATPQF